MPLLSASGAAAAKLGTMSQRQKNLQAHREDRFGLEAPQAELADLLRFETLMADLSSAFVNIPVAAVDDEIRDAMRRVGESQDVDFPRFGSG